MVNEGCSGRGQEERSKEQERGIGERAAEGSERESE